MTDCYYPYPVEEKQGGLVNLSRPKGCGDGRTTLTPGVVQGPGPAGTQEAQRRGRPIHDPGRRGRLGLGRETGGVEAKGVSKSRG